MDTDGTVQTPFNTESTPRGDDTIQVPHSVRTVHTRQANTGKMSSCLKSERLKSELRFRRSPVICRDGSREEHLPHTFSFDDREDDTTCALQRKVFISQDYI
jgi:hypothetical protein